jgi:DNA-binding transcriptional LysR family regulator
MPAVDLNLLRILDVLIEERSVTRAGARLGLTQSAVSHALNRLRHALGDELFVRTGAGLRPTSRAMEMAPALHAALAQLQAVTTREAFDPSSTERRFKISAGPYACAVLIPVVVERMRVLAPAAELRISGYRPDLLEALDAGRLDAAIGGFENFGERFALETILDERLVWIVRPGHPLTEGVVTVERLVEHAHVQIGEDVVDRGGAGLRRRSSWEDRGAFERELARRNLHRRIGVTVPDTFSALAVVSRSDMTALAPRRLAEVSAQAGRLVMIEPPYASPAVEVGLLYRRDRMGEPAVAWFLDLLAAAASVAAASALA